MWQGMKARRLQLAASNTIAYILVYPWLIFYLSMVGYALSGVGEQTFTKVLMYWFGLGLVFDAAFGYWAWRTLRLHLRTMAAHQHSGTAYHPIWRALGRLYARWRHAHAIPYRPAS
jgi:hypothetical protein